MDMQRKRLLSLAKRTPFHSLLQYLAYDPDTGVYTLANGNMGMVFEVTPYIYPGEDTADLVAALMNKEMIPDQSMLSFCLWAGRDTAPYRQHNQILRTLRFTTTGDEEVDDLLSNLADEHVNFVCKGTDKPVEGLFDTRVRDVRAYVSLVVGASVRGGAPKLSDDDAMVQLHRDLEQGLIGAGLRPRSVDAKTLVRIIGSMVNWTESCSWKNPEIGYDEDTPIRNQVVDFDHEAVITDGGGLRLNDRHVRVISAHSFPKRVSLSDAYSFLIAPRSRDAKIKDNVIFTTSVFFGNKRKDRDSIRNRRKWAKKQDIAPFNKLEPKLSLIARSFDLLFESAVDGGDRPCAVSFSAAIFGNSEEQARRQSADAISHMRGLRYDMREELIVALPMFVSMLPMNADPNGQVVDALGRFKTCTTRHASRVLPLAAEWKGVGRPVSTYIGRTGQVLSFNNFDNSTNYNMLIMAQSGSGKSVLTCRYIADLLSCGGRVIVIDQGYSYLNSCELFKGEFITFSEGQCPNLNPFPQINEFKEEADMLVGVVVMMAGLDATNADGRFQIASIRQLITKLWNQKGRDARIDDLAVMCGEADDQRVRDIAVLLHPFTLDGEYGHYYSGNTAPVDFSRNRLIVLELDDLKNKDLLSRVVVLQLILMVNSYMYNKTASGDESWAAMVIDEAWKFIASGGDETENATLSFILTAYRQFRKNNGAMAMVTQSLNDVYQAKAGRAFAENAGVRAYLGQNPEALELMREEKKISMDEFWYQQLKGVKTEKGYFSEIFFDTSEAKGVARLVLSPYSLLLFSTESRDRIAIRKEREVGWSIHQSAIRVLQSRGVPEYMDVDVGRPAGGSAYKVYALKEELEERASGVSDVTLETAVEVA
jgi:conjugal transfer ATP-binding protein TraC